MIFLSLSFLVQFWVDFRKDIHVRRQGDCSSLAKDGKTPLHMASGAIGSARVLLTKPAECGFEVCILKM